MSSPQLFQSLTTVLAAAAARLMVSAERRPFFTGRIRSKAVRCMVGPFSCCVFICHLTVKKKGSLGALPAPGGPGQLVQPKEVLGLRPA